MSIKTKDIKGRGKIILCQQAYKYTKNGSKRSRFLMEYVFLRYYKKMIRKLLQMMIDSAILRLKEKFPDSVCGRVKQLKSRFMNRKNIDEWKVKYIQLEITYRCNLLCEKCNRHCNIDLPYLKNADLTIEQFEKFINEVKSKDIYLGRIRILGGEPLLHPQIEGFISTLFYELIVPGYLERIEVITNGNIYRKGKLNNYIKNIMCDPYIKRAFNVKMIKFVISPPDKKEGFFWVLAAPADLGFKWKQCNQPSICGTLLNTYGYWPQGVCGAIARLFCLTEYAKYEFPVYFKKTWPNLEKDLCKYCVFGCEELQNELNRNESFKTISSSYKKAIEKWQNGGGCTFQRY